MAAGSCCLPLQLFTVLAETSLVAEVLLNDTEVRVAGAADNGMVKDRYIIIDDEIMEVTGVAGDVVSVARGATWPVPTPQNPNLNPKP